MFTESKRRLLKSPLFLVGVLTTLLAAGGAILSAATVVSLHFSAPRIPVQLRQAFVPSLQASGTPQQIIQNFLTGRILVPDELARLPETQAQALLAAQESSLPLILTTQQAIQIAVRRTLVGSGVCAIILLVGAALAAKAIKKARTPATIAK